MQAVLAKNAGFCSGATKINNAQVVDISFPEFWERINDLNFT